jgi:hypothetical protein
VNQNKTTWLVAGGALVLAASALMPFSTYDDSALIPVPMHQFVLFLLASYGYVLFLPVAYAVSLYVLWDSRFFGPAVLGLSLIVASLSVWWFVESWAHGISYPGARFTHTVAVENAISLGAALALSLLGVARSSRPHTASAHLAIFLTLAWCAFPLLGRID